MSSSSFVEGARYIDFAFEQAQRNGLKILLELHGAPGSQNGWDHSGRSGTLGWHTSERNIQDTLNVLEELAKRYGKHPAICGIGLLNEPRGDVPIDSLKKFYQDSYSRIRKHTGAGVEIVMHDAFRASEWKGFMQPPAYSHVQLDTHLYQCFTDEDRKRTVQEHVAFAFDRKKHLDMMSKELPTIVGEWSIALPPEVYRGLSPVQASNAKRAYGAAQLLNYESTQGWFYWSYKLEGTSDWSFRQCVENGWLPNNLAA